MNLLAKKINELTEEELQSLYVPLGTSSLPYPATYSYKSTEGSIGTEIGAIADDENPMAIYAATSPEYVTGTLYREMAIPSMLNAQKEMILRRAPDSKNRLMAILGDAGSGKSHLAKMMARVRDPRGAEVVDCGGRYMGDLLWEQAIDFGEDFKTSLTDRIKSGLLSEKSIKIFDEEFRGSLIKDETGKVTGIDWEKIGIPTNGETTSDAITKALGIIENTIAKWEGIPVQTMNNIGVRKIPGALIRAFKEGRELVLDEYTKSIEGSDDSLQTVLQFLTGEIDEAIVENSMKINGREESYAFTFRREDMKPGFFVTITGNKENDGYSTHILSRSAYSRITPFTIDYTGLIDWKHRISQILTGVPLSTMYSVFSDMAQRDPEEFGETMLELRALGLNNNEQEKIPSQQLMMLKKWEKTLEAVNRLAGFYSYWAKIVDPNSDKYDPRDPKNLTNTDLILPEISASYRDESAIDFRKVIKDVESALMIKPKISEIKVGSNLRIDFSAINKKSKTAPQEEKETIKASEFGNRLEETIIERISTMTEGRPNLQKALLTEAKTQRIIGIAELLNQNSYNKPQEIADIETIQQAFSEHFKSLGPFSELVNMDQATVLQKEISLIVSNNNNPDQITTLGSSLNDPFKKSFALDGFKGTTTPETSKLIKVEDFLETLKIPSLANANMQALWQKTLSNSNILSNSKEPEKLRPLIEIAENSHESGLAITTVAAKDNNDKESYIHIISDKKKQQTLIVADFEADRLSRNLSKGFNVVSYNDQNAKDKIQNFVEKSLTGQENSSDLYGQLIGAFMMRAGNSGTINNLNKTLTERNAIIKKPVYITTIND